MTEGTLFHTAAQIFIRIPKHQISGGIGQIFFLFLHENICCGCSLEAPQWGASNEYPQHMFSCRNKKKISILFGWKKCLFWSCGMLHSSEVMVINIRCLWKLAWLLSDRAVALCRCWNLAFVGVDERLFVANNCQFIRITFRSHLSYEDCALWKPALRAFFRKKSQEKSPKKSHSKKITEKKVTEKKSQKKSQQKGYRSKK